ncbi:hypothetical protein ACLS0R_17870 [Comamonas jiangduensis]|uniref:deoxynucleotide monophosphate kinase family protein n=1 Tax=Comamonas jiangduensis TaxID=1194168 RepID=UPI003BF881BE
MLEHAPTIIGLTGANGAGKDTVASMLQAALHRQNRKTAIVAFADALYQEVARAFNCTIEQLQLRSTKEQPIKALMLSMCGDPWFHWSIEQACNVPVALDEPRSPRQILQWWGTEYRRTQNPQYWVQRFQKTAQALLATEVQHVIVTDVRFADEAQCIRAMGGEVWCVHRHNHQPAGTGHISEVTGKEFAPEATIHNAGSMNALQLNSWQALYSSHMVRAQALQKGSV